MSETKGEPMEYIKYGADETRRELIFGDERMTFNIYDLNALTLAPSLTNEIMWVFCLLVGETMYKFIFTNEGKDQAVSAYALIKKDWDWYLEQEAANLDDLDEDQIEC